MPNETQFKTHEDYLNWYRNYKEENKLKLREYSREYNKQWRYRVGYYNNENWAKKNPEKVKAQHILQEAVRVGKIKRELCQECGSDYLIHGHHEDYNKPLEVKWLCPLCHTHLHIEKTKCQK